MSRVKELAYEASDTEHEQEIMAASIEEDVQPAVLNAARHYVILTEPHAPAFASVIGALAWSRKSPEASNTITTCDCGDMASHDAE